jgi:predicted PurR-regulated permease PerM
VLENALIWWMVGRFSSMAVVGIMTMIGLWILGIPLPFTLGVIAAVLSFIPNIGPIISVIPALLLALLDSPSKVLYVILLYIGIQTVESYIITPLIQKRAVSLPPALLISVQIMIGVLLGAFGLILATPLMVVIIVLVQTIYIQDIIGDKVTVLGERNHKL